MSPRFFSFPIVCVSVIFFFYPAWDVWAFLNLRIFLFSKFWGRKWKSAIISHNTSTLPLMISFWNPFRLDWLQSLCVLISLSLFPFLSFALLWIISSDLYFINYIFNSVISCFCFINMLLWFLEIPLDSFFFIKLVNFGRLLFPN